MKRVKLWFRRKREKKLTVGRGYGAHEVIFNYQNPKTKRSTRAERTPEATK